MATPLQKMTEAGTQLQKFIPPETQRIDQRRTKIQRMLQQARKLGLTALAQKLLLMRGHCDTILDALSDEQEMLGKIDFATAKPGSLTQFAGNLGSLESRIDTFAGMYRGMLPKAKALFKNDADKFDAKLAAWFKKETLKTDVLDGLVDKLTSAVNAAAK
jgi:hypothetical protein